MIHCMRPSLTMRVIPCCGRWALRVAPSSGNLQTTELHVLLPAMEGLADKAAAYHYLPELHTLELRLPMPPEPPVHGTCSQCL